ncbi:DUF4185 domain-containing protein [Nocardia sp. 2]|uniref:DUF4185 domain-containing protein n=1 Tax=Nocardia acididurans TaxID=2802282 RepID=A0ABS1LXW3_9NOCA|nr:DUF4185 domain-containing protein [Nocardia acididurans]MBL1073217.1 DUF4185 domain-containing protein [Nocardia acididurans]
MGWQRAAAASRAETPAVLALSGVITLGAVLLPAAPATAGPHPYAPPPVNSCGETGFDPLYRKAPDGYTPPVNPTIAVPVPVPQILQVPMYGPKADNTRIVADPLPEDPCANPCPDIRDTPPKTTPPNTPGGGSVALPQISIKPEPEIIPVPVPGGEPPEPQPAPEAAVQVAAPGPVAAPVGAPGLESVRVVGQLTGPGSANRTDMRWSVDGTDLGLMWETKPGEVAVVFGDTFGKGWQPGGAGTDQQDWRSNVIGYSTDTDLSDGLTLDTFAQDSRCHAAEILSSRKIGNYEVTTIPTSGFALDDRQYLTYMSVKRWSKIPGMWWTNHGGIAWSDDNGSTWTKSQWAQWDNLFGLGRFQVATMVPHGDHVYMFGTPNGRIGVIGLARVPKDQVLNKTAYQYWIDGVWQPAATAHEFFATPVVSGTASELSIRYDTASGRWQMVYLDTLRHQIVLRTAAEPQGAWSEPVALLDTDDYPTAYGGFIHPWSTGNELYFAVSTWNAYNVFLMQATLR